jgi:transposase-like protein
LTRTEEVAGLLPELYLHGLAQGDFELALRGLLGESAPLSPSSIERLRGKWAAEYEAWKGRSLRDVDAVYLWADGIYVKAGFGDTHASLLVVVAALRSGRKVVLAVESGQRESKESWAEILRDLRRRGLDAPRLLVADGHLGIWAAAAEVFPEVEEQRCWNHSVPRRHARHSEEGTTHDRASRVSLRSPAGASPVRVIAREPGSRPPASGGNARRRSVVDAAVQAT